jgi:hypothetical protein
MRRSLGNDFIAGLSLLHGVLWLFFGPRQGLLQRGLQPKNIH